MREQSVSRISDAAAILGRVGGAAARDKSGGTIQRRAIAARWARYRSRKAAQAKDHLEPVLNAP